MFERFAHSFKLTSTNICMFVPCYNECMSLLYANIHSGTNHISNILHEELKLFSSTSLSCCTTLFFRQNQIKTWCLRREISTCGCWDVI